jgi:hypothetical protein
VRPVTITLGQPIERRAAESGRLIERITELTLRPPTLGDLVAAMDAAGGAAAPGTLTLHLAARLAGLSPRDLEGLSLADGAEVLAAVTGFMPAGLLAGTSGSPSSPEASASLPTGATGGQPN